MWLVSVSNPALRADEAEPPHDVRVELGVEARRIAEAVDDVGCLHVAAVHEFTHDLGAPDLYDYYGENGTAFWTLMSSGSWLSDNLYNLGTAPNHQDAWVKLQLGWLDYEVAASGETTKLTIGPAEYNSSQPQALLVDINQGYLNLAEAVLDMAGGGPMKTSPASCAVRANSSFSDRKP